MPSDTSSRRKFHTLKLGMIILMRSMQRGILPMAMIYIVSVKQFIVKLKDIANAPS